MPQTGKIPREFFSAQIAPYLGADRLDVHLGPKHGVDFGVLDIDGTALVLATDPISVLPELGLERAGRFTVRIVLADVAVSGLSPSHLAVSFSLPPEFSDAEFTTVLIFSSIWEYSTTFSSTGEGVLCDTPADPLLGRVTTVVLMQSTHSCLPPFRSE